MDSSDEDRCDKTPKDTVVNDFTVKSAGNIRNDMIPKTSSATRPVNDIKMDNATFYEMVCSTMKEIEDARTCERSTEIETGNKRPYPRRTSAVPRKKSHDDGEMGAGKLSIDLKTARPRGKERKNVKNRGRGLSSESESSSRSESSR